jgi:hypothetical protein
VGWRFRKSVKILPGVRLNFGKRGLTSTTIGSRWFKTNLSSRGVKHTVSVPGTGISYQTETYRGRSAAQDAEGTDVRLYWYCASCYVANLPDNRSCYKCGGAYNPNPQERAPASPSGSGSPLLILVAVLLALVLLALVGVGILVVLTRL